MTRAAISASLLTIPFKACSFKHVPSLKPASAFPQGIEITFQLFFWSRHMSRRLLPIILCTSLLVSLSAGCGSDGGTPVRLAEAGGVVTFKGAPLADATVTFIPDNGPIATGVTDLSGKFTLMTGSRAGAAVGPCRVSVAAYAAGAAPG